MSFKQVRMENTGVKESEKLQKNFCKKKVKPKKNKLNELGEFLWVNMR